MTLFHHQTTQSSSNGTATFRLVNFKCETVSQILFIKLFYHMMTLSFTVAVAGHCIMITNTKTGPEAQNIVNHW